MKKLLLPILLLSTNVFASNAPISIAFELTEMTIPAKDTIDNFVSKFEIAFDYNKEVDYVQDKEFKAQFEVVEANGLPQLTIKLFDYDKNEELFPVGNFTLNTNWGSKSEVTWWYKATKYSISATPKKR
ncbi:MAG: hypothetical protein PHE38_05090 [Alishewanella agri]|nr:hypothetical protein [Alishewanella agri]